MKKKLILGIFVIGIVFCSLLIKTQAITVSFNIEDQSTESSNFSLSPISSELFDLSLTLHEPIEIINDGNFTHYGFSGTGTPEEPYIIENYYIITASDYGIYINGTTKHFVIRNCYVEAYKRGILISYIAEGTASLINNTCMNHYYQGISLFYSSEAEISNNTCIGNSNGIRIGSSTGVTITNNSFTNNHAGIRLSGSSDLTITNNSLSGNFNGIDLDTCLNASITNNTFSNNEGNGITLYYSTHSTLGSNKFYNCGISIHENIIENYSNYTLENNLVNNKLLGFFVNQNSVIILEPIYGQLILINCTEIVIHNQELSNAGTGLTIKSSGNTTISDNICNNNYGSGIDISGFSRVILTNNICSNNRWYGIDIVSPSNVILKNNTCSENGFHGIDLSGSSSAILIENRIVDNEEYGIELTSCPEAIVTNNTFTNNYWDGINLDSCPDALVSNNTFTWNGIGIDMRSCTGAILMNNTCINNGIGISLGFSSNNNLTKNTCKNNNMYGIMLSYSDYCLITYNLLQENYGYGIYLYEMCEHNIIHHNSFIDNNQGGTSQACDYGNNNIWFDSTINEGNWWSDWTGSPSYPIDGSANSIDPFPLGEPAVSEFTQISGIIITLFLSLALIPLLLRKKKGI